MREGADAKRRELYVTSSASHLRLPTACESDAGRSAASCRPSRCNAESVLHPTREKRSSEDRAKACCEIRGNQEKRFPSAKYSGRACCGAAMPSPNVGVRKPLENQAENALEHEADVWVVNTIQLAKTLWSRAAVVTLPAERCALLRWTMMQNS